jgi:hypothetical protein
MVTELKIIEGKKYMWDGKTYENDKQAKEIKTKYEKDGFEVQLLKDKNQYVIYTRRVVKDVVLEGEPPL